MKIGVFGGRILEFKDRFMTIIQYFNNFGYVRIFFFVLQPFVQS